MDALPDLPGATRLGSGKVRELYALPDDRLLLVASDRVSAYDVILPTPIPDKGKVLTGLTAFWAGELADVVPTHLLSTDVADLPEELQRHAEALRGRVMLCRRADMLPVECVARGYLAGSAWEEYQVTGRVAGLPVPQGLREAEELPRPLFTPATKATSGHDENITFDDLVVLVGEDLAERLRGVTLALYERGRALARDRGVLLADTKFELGTVDGRLLLCDEILTPDSSRFWPADGYAPGRPQASFDKQIIRDWLTDRGWDRTPPGPALPDEVVERTRDRYVDVYERLTGTSFSDWTP